MFAAIIWTRCSIPAAFRRNRLRRSSRRLGTWVMRSTSSQSPTAACSSFSAPLRAGTRPLNVPPATSSSLRWTAITRTGMRVDCSAESIWAANWFDQPRSASRVETFVMGYLGPLLSQKRAHDVVPARGQRWTVGNGRSRLGGARPRGLPSGGGNLAGPEMNNGRHFPMLLSVWRMRHYTPRLQEGKSWLLARLRRGRRNFELRFPPAASQALSARFVAIWRTHGLMIRTICSYSRLRESTAMQDQ